MIKLKLNLNTFLITLVNGGTCGKSCVKMLNNFRCDLCFSMQRINEGSVHPFVYKRESINLAFARAYHGTMSESYKR